jgi:hypothetical protein
MKAYTRTSLPVIKLNVSSPEGDDKKGIGFNTESSAAYIDTNKTALKLLKFCNLLL